jgi:hypothetical protein
MPPPAGHRAAGKTAIATLQISYNRTILKKSGDRKIARIDLRWFGG